MVYYTFLMTIASFLLGLNIANATDTTFLEDEAAYFVGQIKSNEKILHEDLKLTLARCKGSRMIFVSLEDLQNAMEDFLDPNDIDPKYIAALSNFLQLARAEYEKISQESKDVATDADPLGALLWEVESKLTVPVN